MHLLFREKIGERLYAQVEEALAVGGNAYTVEDIIHACMAGDMYMVHGVNALCVVEMHDLPRSRTLHVHLAAGDLEELFGPMYAHLTRMARHNHCDRFTMVGRRGWERVAARRIGGVATQSMMELRLPTEDAKTNKNEVPV